MSRWAQPNGDDHPETAGKHLDDATILARTGRPDGAAYLAGYVVECCLKTLIQVETGVGQKGHALVSFADEVPRLAAVAGARIAKYATALPVRQMRTSQIAAWSEQLRYRAPGAVTPPDAATWLAEACAVYESTVGQLRLDGIL
jgi:HEPN domain-containing protein